MLHMNISKIQRGYTIIGTSSATATITAGTDYTAPTGEAFIRIVNTRLTGNGNTGGGFQNIDDFTAFIQNPNNLATSITFSRVGTSNNNRIAWEIIEYIGPSGEANEFLVRDEGTLSFTTSDTSLDTSTIPVTDDNDIIVFVTGQRGADSGRTNWGANLFTSEWIGASDIARFTRGDLGSVSADLSYAEWWSLMVQTGRYKGSSTLLQVLAVSKRKAYLLH